MQKTRNGREYSVVIEREDDGRYSAYVPDLPGCASMGDTKREALANVREAITCYLEGLRKLGRAIPRRRALVEVVKVKAA
jgi:predicted RNase H-like HicB family nuclease